MAGPRTTSLPDLLTSVGPLLAAVLEDRADADENAAAEAGPGPSRVASATVALYRRAALVIRESSGGDS